METALKSESPPRANGNGVPTSAYPVHHQATNSEITRQESESDYASILTPVPGILLQPSFGRCLVHPDESYSGKDTVEGTSRNSTPDRKDGCANNGFESDGSMKCAKGDNLTEVQNHQDTDQVKRFVVSLGICFRSN